MHLLEVLLVFVATIENYQRRAPQTTSHINAAPTVTRKSAMVLAWTVADTGPIVHTTQLARQRNMVSLMHLPLMAK